MIISELKIYNFRRFQSVDGAPGLQITFHKGLNALIGENDSGKTAVIDALKLVLLTQSNEYIRPVDEDFYTSANGEACTEFRIDCFITEFSQNEAKNFVEYLKFRADGEKVEYTLELHYRAWREGHKIYQELRVGDADDGISIDGKARDLLKAVYLKPLRDAEREMSSGRSSRISQILLNHPVFKDKNEHTVLGIFQDANQKIEEYFTNDPEGKSILQTIRDNLEAFNDKGQKSDAELKTSDIQIKAILESLSLKAPELNPGLGELNLLFIAAELLLLKDDSLMYQRNNKNYEMLINICYFVLDGMLQTTDKGNYKMMTFSDEHMHRLYEKFVLEYFKRHHSYLSEVRAAQVKWNLATDTEESMIRFLPAMQTDIFLRYKEKVLIIDTKYYGNSMQKQYDKVTIHSGNMYQIFTYVKNQDVENNGRVSGMLLYAKTEEAITPDCSFVIGGNKISVKTVDLNKEFKLIAAQLDKIAEDYFGKKRIEDSII